MLPHDAQTYTADLHLHSRYAYATSKHLSLENLAAWAKIKGIDLLSCADFTHPLWIEELRRGLAEDGTGLFDYNGVKFVLGAEVSCVYRQGSRGRRVHMLVFAPDLATVEALNGKLGCHGSLASDGRPTLKLSARDLVEIVLECNPQCVVIPAHIWTPWYGILGSKSGFDSLEECFLDMASHIHAVETGLSSDPAMNALGAEVSCVYRQGSRGRRVHMLVFAPDLATVEALNGKLGCHGSLASDGRPTLKLSARDLVEIVLECNPQCVVIPAHIWTPWYGILGSKSGFDSLEECFLDMASHIHAVETGLSSDPAMNWMIPELGGRTIVSFSDAHSLAKLGREVTVFQGELSYRGLARALANECPSPTPTR